MTHCIKRTVEGSRELKHSHSLLQFNPKEIFTKNLMGYNVPIMFPKVDEENLTLSYTPVFFKRPTSATWRWWGAVRQEIQIPVFFDTKGMVERESRHIMYNQLRNKYRFMTSKRFDYVDIKNTQIRGYRNTRSEIKLLGTKYIKANRSVYGQNHC